jgi:hypothetical protein
MKRLANWFRQLVTEPDNKTHCPIRWVALLGTLQGLSMQAYQVFIQHAAFNLQEYGVGLGAIIATVGAALGMKKDTPKDNP